MDSKEQTRLQGALEKNLNWFRHSGIMLPSDGMWGVGERIAVTSGNDAIQKIRSSFPAITEHDGWCVVEQRRADCNFQAAYLFLLCGRILGNAEYANIGENIVHFLYSRSGLLDIKTSEPRKLIRGTWQWSHIGHHSKIYYDDEAWCLFMQLEIAKVHPELAQKYEMRYWANALAEELWIASDRALRERNVGADGHWHDSGWWNGLFDLPHWGALACMALARSCWNNDDADKVAKYSDVINRYLDYIADKAHSLTCSEQTYLILACMAAWRYLKNEKAHDMAINLGNLLVSCQDEQGNLPAQHYEAPTGTHLVDLIYTINWAALGFQALAGENDAFAAAKKKVHELVVKLQDTSTEPQFNGCWRGMFDLNAKTWGGGDRYEGGAGSIYSGWTNAPISIAIALDLMGRDLFSTI